MQKFLFPMKYLRVTQGENDPYSHKGNLAMDFGGKDGGSDKLYAPCDMVVKRCRQRANGEMYLESTNKVEFADGTIDFAHMLCLHDSSFNVREGQVIKQGQYFYDEGGMGSNNPHRFGTHVHIEAGKGKWINTRQFPNKYGVYISENQSHLYDLFYIGTDVEILEGKGYNWTRVMNSTLSKEPSKLKIGFASGGDIKTIEGELNRLGIAYTESDGYIVTDVEVSYGDKVVVEVKCNSLSVPIVDYKEPVVEECANCKRLEEENESLKSELEQTRKTIVILKDKLNKIHKESEI